MLMDDVDTVCMYILHTTGNILDNKELLDSLNETKAKSNTIAASLSESKALQASLDTQREVYRPIAQRGSALYFLIKDLATVNHMYQFSLSVFLTLFRKVGVATCQYTSVVL